MARTRKQRRLRGGQPAGTKRRAESSPEELAAQQLVELSAEDKLPILAETAAKAEPLPEPPALKKPRGRSPSTVPAKPRARSVSRPRISPVGATPKQALQYHLKADMDHDHSIDKPEKINIFEEKGFPELKDIVPDAMAGSLNEDTVRTYFVEGETPLDPEIPDKQERFKLRTRFVMPPETSDFYSAKFTELFRPFPAVEEKKVGVLQDAGIQIYKMMGARNIITYGSILDQAGKPTKDAYYYKSDVKEVALKPADFGFDESVVSSIKIVNFNGQNKTAECVFTINGKDRGSDGPIQLNQRGGDFKSVEEVRQLWKTIKEAKGAAGYTPDQLVDAFAAFVGKALGDILLVTSIGKDDPLNPTNKKLTPLGSSTPGQIEATEILLNTGDRLNHVRAFIRGVHSMYSSANPTTKLRTYEFLPGSLAPVLAKGTKPPSRSSTSERVIPALTAKQRVRIIQDTVKDVYKRYTDLLKHLDTVTPATTKRDGSGNYVRPEQAGALGAFIDELKVTVDALRTYVGFYYLVFFRAHEKETDIEKLTAICEQLLREVTFLTPQFSSTLKEKGETVRPTLVLLRAKDHLRYSSYTIQNIDQKIDYAKEVKNENTREDGIIPYTTVHAELASITGILAPGKWIPDERLRSGVNSPNKSISGVLTVRLCDKYNLIGRGELSTAYEEVLLFRPVPETPPVMEGGGSNEIFGKTYYSPTVDTEKIGIDDVDEKGDIQLDLVADFIGERTRKEAVREFLLAEQTFKQNAALCFDTTLFEELGEQLRYTFDPFPQVSGFVSEESLISTKEALLVNAFMCERAKNILDTYMTADGEIEPADSEFGKVLAMYTDRFRKLAKESVEAASSSAESEASAKSKESAESGPSLAATASLDAAATMDSSMREPSSGSQSPMSMGSPSRSIGGQRVSAANFIIDTTKSFVK